MVHDHRPARYYSRFWIWRPSSEHQRDFNPPDQCAARRTLWPPPTSHPASSWISLHQLIPFVTVVVGYRPDETSPVPHLHLRAVQVSSTFTTSRSPYTGGFFTAVFPGSSPLPWPSLLAQKLGSLFVPFGLTFRCCKIHFFCELLLCSPFSGGYNASAHPVTQMHWLHATWPSVRYQDWTSTSKQTMTFQDTRAGVGPQNFADFNKSVHISLL